MFFNLLAFIEHQRSPPLQALRKTQASDGLAALHADARVTPRSDDYDGAAAHAAPHDIGAASDACLCGAQLEGDRPLPLGALPASHLMLPVQMQFTCRCNRDSIKSTRRRAGGRDLSRLRRAGHATVAGRCRTVALQTGLPVAGVRLVCYSRSPQVKQSRRATVSRSHFAPLRMAHCSLVSRQRPDGRWSVVGIYHLIFACPGLCSEAHSFVGEPPGPLR